jgi:tRNA-dihydrouridine synthase A
VLKGLSPKENREVPPLRYDVVRQLKRDFPGLTIVLNGGLTDWDAIERELEGLDGAMLGRVAYHDPYFLAQAGVRLFGDDAPARSRAEVLRALLPYAEAQLARGVPLRAIARPVLGLYHGCTGGRRVRQILSDAAKLKNAGPELFLEALAAVEPTATPA